jgi:hypothetical protein
MTCRFVDDVEMDVAAAYVPSQAYEFLPSYNCTPGADSCELFLYDPAGRAQEKSTAIVQWSYGFQNFELRCYAKQSLWLSALYSIIAWPLLMSILVILLYVLVYLILKRLESFEREKLCMEKFNDDLRAAKLAAEAADKAKSSFLATVSHEIRYWSGQGGIWVHSLEQFFRNCHIYAQLWYEWFWLLVRDYCQGSRSISYRVEHVMFLFPVVILHT